MSKPIIWLAIVVGLSGFMWLKEHDKQVAWRATAEARRDSLERQDSTLDVLWRSIKAMDSVYAGMAKRHAIAIAKMRDSVTTLDARVDSLGAAIISQLSVEHRPMVDALIQSCRAQRDLVQSNLRTCESLRADLERENVRKDALVLGLSRSRDAYKKLADEAEAPKSDTWSVVGKATTTVGVLALIIKLISELR